MFLISIANAPKFDGPSQLGVVVVPPGLPSTQDETPQSLQRFLRLHTINTSLIYGCENHTLNPIFLKLIDLKSPRYSQAQKILNSFITRYFSPSMV
jgi:hypothetical protein